MSVVLEAKNLKKVYTSRKGGLRTKELIAVDDVSFAVNEGEILGFIGPNGAGKTTTIKMLTGLARPSGGEVVICGYSVSKEHTKAMRYVGGVIETPDMYPDMSGLNNLKYLVTLHPKDTMIDTSDTALQATPKKQLDARRVEDVLKMVGLWDRRNDLVRKYSLGMKQRLGIAQALLSKPKLLILDEPANGLDPAGIKYIRDLLRNLADVYKMGILVSSHQLSELQLMCDRVLIINNGKIVSEKRMDQLDADEAGTAVIVIKTDRLQESTSYLKEKLALDAQINGSEIRVRTAIDIGTITKELVLGGYNILGIYKEEVRLEDVFINATKEDGNV